MADPTFRNYTAAQATAYATYRGGAYPPLLYDTILSYHHKNNPPISNTPTSNTTYADTTTDDNDNAKLDLLLDVGCGPGTVVFDLLPFFRRAVGVDAGVEMVEAARRDGRGGEVGTGRVRFEVREAEKCDEVLEEGTVDVVTVAMAAHWFDMPAFYTSVAKVLKPGGTLAIWTCSSAYAHPSNPNYQTLQTILSNLEDNILAPYQTPGNKLSRSGYATLPFPWTMTPPFPAFDKTAFERRDWDIGGIPSAPPNADGSPGPYLRQEDIEPERLGMAMGTSSMGTRWREANREKIEKGEIEDCGVEVGRRLKEVLELSGRETMTLGSSSSLLLFRRV